MRAGASSVPFVLDASVTLCWLFQDESDRTADIAGQLLLGNERAIVPLIWWFEVRNVIVVGMRRKRVSAERVRTFLIQSEASPIDIDDEIPVEGAVFEAAHNHQLSFYDACYLELAVRNGVPLATLDKSLARAAIAAGVPLIGT
jgi:predicted nucleic acid-binding protein